MVNRLECNRSYADTWNSRRAGDKEKSVMANWAKVTAGFSKEKIDNLVDKILKGMSPSKKAKLKRKK